MKSLGEEETLLGVPRLLARHSRLLMVKLGSNSLLLVNMICLVD